MNVTLILLTHVDPSQEDGCSHQLTSPGTLVALDRRCRNGLWEIPELSEIVCKMLWVCHFSKESGHTSDQVVNGSMICLKKNVQTTCPGSFKVNALQIVSFQER